MTKMRRLLRNIRYEITMVSIIMCVAVAVFLFFKTFFDLNLNSVTTEILAAMLGAIITVMITMLLIRQQGTIKQATEESAASKTKIFEKKLELFQEFIKTYAKIVTGGKAEEADIIHLKSLAISISLFTKKADGEKGSHDLGEVLCRFVLQIEVFGIATHQEILEGNITAEQKARYKEIFGADFGDDYLSLSKIIALMKVRLAIASVDLDDVDAGEINGDAHTWAQKLLQIHRNSG
ncbi:MAG: hypothetical protein MPK36_09120 [Gammaproteobacteria bacterium]|nr:hypothetical protein [Gammaproteobacteria bacterium]